MALLPPSVPRNNPTLQWRIVLDARTTLAPGVASSSVRSHCLDFKQPHEHRLSFEMTYGILEQWIVDILVANNACVTTVDRSQLTISIKLFAYGSISSPRPIPNQEALRFFLDKAQDKNKLDEIATVTLTCKAPDVVPGKAASGPWGTKDDTRPKDSNVQGFAKFKVEWLARTRSDLKCHSHKSDVNACFVKDDRHIPITYGDAAVWAKQRWDGVLAIRAQNVGKAEGDLLDENDDTLHTSTTTPAKRRTAASSSPASSSDADEPPRRKVQHSRQPSQPTTLIMPSFSLFEGVPGMGMGAGGGEQQQQQAAQAAMASLGFTGLFGGGNGAGPSGSSAADSQHTSGAIAGPRLSSPITDEEIKPFLAWLATDEGKAAGRTGEAETWAQVIDTQGLDIRNVQRSGYTEEWWNGHAVNAGSLDRLRQALRRFRA
ncbi:hypothetical protein JCM11641_007062 [Rhodosporidiobolus odoratus]